MPFLLMGVTRRFKRLGINPGVLISGDPYISGLLVYLLKQFRFRKSVVQFQVHGHPFQYFKIFSIRQLILKLIYLFNLNHADSIRLVSESQQQYDFLASRVNQAKFFIAPIPIIDLGMGLPEGKREEGLLFLGRFHHERNLDLWLEIAENIALRFPELRMTMAGSGPLTEFVINYKAIHPSLNALELLGEIAHSEIEEVLYGNTILLSTAEHESYGLSLREAMLSGLFVVAKSNPTTILLRSDFPNLVRTFTTATEAADIIASLVGREAPKDEITKIRLQQSSKNLQSVNSLVRTWIIAH
jgi:glycosyltransferase involved in cell wall biosynthesis